MEDVETVASVLNIVDDLVYNCLVDNSRINQIALSASKDASERALLVRVDGKDTIRGGKLKVVYFLPEGDH